MKIIYTNDLFLSLYKDTMNIVTIVTDTNAKVTSQRELTQCDEELLDQEIEGTNVKRLHFHLDLASQEADLMRDNGPGHYLTVDAEEALRDTLLTIKNHDLLNNKHQTSVHWLYYWSGNRFIKQSHQRVLDVIREVFKDTTTVIYLYLDDVKFSMGLQYNSDLELENTEYTLKHDNLDFTSKTSITEGASHGPCSN